jgi:succinate dehydrogenase flavin-adding protein (antitoxin of CptAB toxin-antitoxin module)
MKIPFTLSVDSVLKQFTKAADQLDAIAARETNRFNRLLVEQDQAFNEADRAAKASQKIRTLLG